MAQPRADYDSPWKEIIEFFFPQFIHFFFPAIAVEIDWSQRPVFMDKELQQVVRESETGRHTVDKLVQVKLKNGDNVWLLIHIEVQSQLDGTFTRRMFISNVRLFDRYNMEVISLSVLSDEDPDWRPDHYRYGRWGSETGLRFPYVKLLDYIPRWAELEKDPNPFAVVVMAHLKAQATRRKSRDRLRWKINLVQGLYARGYKRKEVRELLRFIDWVMAQSPLMEGRFWNEVQKLEEVEKMRYMMSIERLAIEEGIELGMEQGLEQGLEQGIEQGKLETAREDVLEILLLRFKTIPQDLVDFINNLTNLQQLKLLLRHAATQGTLEEFEQFVETEINV